MLDSRTVLAGCCHRINGTLSAESPRMTSPNAQSPTDTFYSIHIWSASRPSDMDHLHALRNLVWQDKILLQLSFRKLDCCRNSAGCIPVVLLYILNQFLSFFLNQSRSVFTSFMLHAWMNAAKYL